MGGKWLEATKKYKKETIIDNIKTDKEFFLKIVKALKEATFEHYDLEKNSEGLKWLEDSQKFINFDSLQAINECEDSLEVMSFQSELIINQFKNLIEKTRLVENILDKG